MHERTTVSEKSFCFFSSSLSFRWWVLWSRTPLHVALSCTTSSSRSLLLWRTTSTSAAVRPEPESVICFFFFFPIVTSLLLTAAFFLTKAIWKWCPPKQKPFLKCRYFWKGMKSGRAKDLNLCSTIFFSRLFFFFLLISECQELILNVSLRHRQTCSLAQPYREHGGALLFWTLQWVGPTVSPGGNLKHWTLFLRANESQWCTALYYNVHSNIYRCVI